MVNRFPKFIHNWKKRWCLARKKWWCWATQTGRRALSLREDSRDGIHLEKPSWKPIKIGYVWLSKTQICMGFGPPNSETQKKSFTRFSISTTHPRTAATLHSPPHPRRTPCASQQLASLCPGSCEDLPSTPRVMLRWWRQPRLRFIVLYRVDLMIA
jgi:hypothetical protein